jgi:hypothetical protein
MRADMNRQALFWLPPVLQQAFPVWRRVDSSSDFSKPLSIQAWSL